MAEQLKSCGIGVQMETSDRGITLILIDNYTQLTSSAGSAVNSSSSKKVPGKSGPTSFLSDQTKPLLMSQTLREYQTMISAPREPSIKPTRVTLSNSIVEESKGEESVLLSENGLDRNNLSRSQAEWPETSKVNKLKRQSSII